jgi:hypothetical protein
MGVDAIMLIKGVSEKAVTEDWLTEVSFYLMASIGAKHFYIKKFGEIQRAIEKADVSIYEGSIAPDKGECLLEVNTASRHYKVGGERGDILTMCCITEWIEQNIPGSAVLYGDDQTYEFVLFDKACRNSLKRHLYSRNGRLKRMSGLSVGAAPSCQLCVCGDFLGYPLGSKDGGSGQAFFCYGCQSVLRTRDGGDTWADE